MTYEEKTEERPFTPEIEAGLLDIVLRRAPAELEQLASADSDSDAFVHLPGALQPTCYGLRPPHAAELKRWASHALVVG